MSLTIISAKYANSQNTSVVMNTTERGHVLVSQVDRPQLWQELQDWITGGGTIQAYVPQPVRTPSDLAGDAVTASPVFRGLIKVLANRFGITPQQLIDAIKAQANGI